MNSTPFIPANNKSLPFRATILQKPAYRTQMCREYLEGFCTYGETCRFAHSAEQLRPAPRAPNYKTVPCRSYSKTGSCKYGRKCQFLHDEMHTVKSPVTYSTTASPSPSTAGFSDYTASYAPKSPCHSYRARGFCRYISTCRYSHEKPDATSTSSKSSDSTTNSSSSWTVRSNKKTASPADSMFHGYSSKNSSIWAPVKSSNPTKTSPLSSTIGSPSDSMFDSYSSSTDPSDVIELLLSDYESLCSSPEPMPTDEPWPLNSLDRLRLTQTRSSDKSPPSVDERYPSSLIALRPIYDEWQRIQKEPWGKPQKTDAFNPFFY